MVIDIELAIIEISVCMEYVYKFLRDVLLIFRIVRSTHAYQQDFASTFWV